MGVNFESSKEIFNALENVNKDILACFDVPSRLKVPTLQEPARVGPQGTYHEENTSTSEDSLCGRENLSNLY